MFRRRHIKLPIHDGIAAGVLVDVGGAMPNPLARHENWQLDVELDLTHFEGGRVAMAEEVTDQAAILLYPLGSTAVGDASRLHNGRVIAHIVDNADKAVIQNGQRRIKDLLQRRYGRPPR